MNEPLLIIAFQSAVNAWQAHPHHVAKDELHGRLLTCTDCEKRNGLGCGAAWGVKPERVGGNAQATLRPRRGRGRL